MALRTGRVRMPVGDTFASLRFPNYRLWFFGQMLSLMGTWMQSSAQSYLVYDLTGSAKYLGYLGFAAGIPSVLFMLFAGVLADRFPRRRLMIVIQGGMMLLAFFQAWLTFSGQIQPWHLLGLSFALGVLNAFDAPIRLSFVPELVERSHLTNAIALNATMFTSAVVIGPAIGGLVYSRVGPAWCFVINAFSFVFVIGALVLMNLATFKPRERKTSILDDLKEGLRYVWRQPMLRILITLVGAISVFVFGMVSLMPAWSVEILQGNAETNGLLLSARGAGSLLASLTLATVSQRLGRGRIVSFAVLVLPLFSLSFALARLQVFSMLAIFAIGWAVILLNNSCNALVQSSSPDDLRGRVMSVFTLVMFGGAPLGSLLLGSLADRFTIPLAAGVSAAGLVAVASALWLLAPQVRRLV